MARSLEYLAEGIVDPKVWLAWSDIQNRPIFENPFIENLVKGTKKAFSELRRQHQLSIIPKSDEIENSDYLPVLNKRFLIKVGLSLPLAFAVYGFSLISSAFIRETILNGSANNQDLVLTPEWREVTSLPYQAADDWIVDQAWVDTNCSKGKWLGTGVPEFKPISINPNDRNPYLQEINALVKSGRATFATDYSNTADALCITFGDSNQPTP